MPILATFRAETFLFVVPTPAASRKIRERTGSDVRKGVLAIATAVPPPPRCVEWPAKPLAAQRSCCAASGAVMSTLRINECLVLTDGNGVPWE